MHFRTHLKVSTGFGSIDRRMHSIVSRSPVTPVFGVESDALQMIDISIEGRLMSNGSEISSLGGADHVLIEGDNLRS